MGHKNEGFSIATFDSQRVANQGWINLLRPRSCRGTRRIDEGQAMYTHEIIVTCASLHNNTYSHIESCIWICDFTYHIN